LLGDSAIAHEETIMHKTWIALAALLGCGLLPQYADAEKTYRCGNTFQDRPCGAVQSGQSASPTPPHAAPAARPGAEVRPVSQTTSAREAKRRRDLCESLTLQLDDVRSQQRAGGNADAKEKLGHQAHDIESRLSANRC
jgi:hypothetical protein